MATSEFLNAGPTTVMVGDGLLGTGSMVDPIQALVDGSTVEINGSAEIAVIDPLVLTTFQGAYTSSDGTAGATAGPFTTITAIRVRNGIVTTLTGS